MFATRPSSRLGAALVLALALATAGAGVAVAAASGDRDTPVAAPAFPADWEARLKAAVPGYGGLFVKDDTIHVWVKGEADPAAVRTEVARVLGPEATAHHKIVIDKARYTLAELEQWQALDWFAIRGVQSVGVAQMENRLVVGVDTDATRARVLAQLSRLGVPADAVRIEVTGPVQILPAMEGGAMVASGTEPAERAGAGREGAGFAGRTGGAPRTVMLVVLGGGALAVLVAAVLGLGRSAVR